MNINDLKQKFSFAEPQHVQLTAKQYIKVHYNEWVLSYPTQLYQIIMSPGITAIISILSFVNCFKFYSITQSFLVAFIQLNMLVTYLVAFCLYRLGYKKLFLFAMQALPLVMAFAWVSENYLLHQFGKTSPPNDLNIGVLIAVIWLLSFSYKSIHAYALASAATISSFVGIFLIDESFVDFNNLEKFVEPFTVGIFLNYLMARLTEYRFYSSRQNKAIKGIFDSSKSALFTISVNNQHDLFIDVERSPAFYKLLGEATPDRLSFHDYFLSKAGLSDTEKTHLVDVLSTILNGDSLTYELNSDNLPLAITIDLNRSKLFLSFSWEPIFNDQGVVERLTVSASDTTRQWQAEAERDHEKSKTRAILELISAAKSPSIRFIRSTYEALERIKGARLGSDVQSIIDDVLGLIHSIKGDSRTLRLTRITDEAHLAETNIILLRKSNYENIDMGVLHGYIDGLYESVCDYKLILETDLNWLHSSDEKIEVSYEFLRDIFLANKSKALEISELLSSLSVDNALAKEALRLLNLALPQADSLIRDVFSQFHDTASKLGRIFPDLKINGALLRFSPTVNSSLTSSLIQLITNSLDHGIERPEARLAIGKPEKGVIEVNISKIGGYYRLTWRDDGAGIDLEQVAKSARNVGIDKNALSHTEVAQLILRPRLTTKSDVSQVSGRGLGLYTVVNHLASFGGSITVELFDKRAENVYDFCFALLIPENMVFIDCNKTNAWFDKSA